MKQDKISYTLRKEDVKDMVKTGTIGQQHFLIQELAASLKLTKPLKSHKQNG